MALIRSLFEGPQKVHISLDFEKGAGERETVPVPSGKETENQLVFYGGEKISGTVTLSSDSPIECHAVTVELIGSVALSFENTTNFTKSQNQIENEMFLLQNPKKWEFCFENVPKTHESYKGSHATVRYFVKVTAVGPKKKNFSKEFNFWVRNTQIPPNQQGAIKLVIGVQDHLHIEFQCEKKMYNTKDVIVGKVFFQLVKLKIVAMELCLIKEETSFRETENTVKQTDIFELEMMDGAPIKGETIPVRVFLERYKLTPTYNAIAKKFDVKYYLKLSLVDETNRRFFKKCEIIVWRQN